MEDINEVKIFTVNEANELLPHLTSQIQDLQARRSAILSMEVEIDTLEMILDKDENGQSPALNQKLEEYQTLVSQFYAIVDEIHSYGCLLKDVSLGLVDFYSLYQGRMVYLCWKIGDSEVSHWHEIGSGYAFRQPIS